MEAFFKTIVCLLYSCVLYNDVPIQMWSIVVHILVVLDSKNSESDIRE